ncbi:hypothetical protein IWQ57_000873 [Coemansia nantahalensis]|nr:hypothetical protein IWQ57_000873 [Coemansia nantahalensis]
MVPESITRTALTHLQVSAPTSVDAMLALIGGLPCLLGLTLFSLDLSDVQVDISVPDADEDVVVDPLHALLKGLAINYDRARNSPDMAVAVVKYMLLRIPSLAVLYAAQAPRDPVLNFVEAYAPRHPHLGSVDMMLYQDEHSANVQWSIRAPK